MSLDDDLEPVLARLKAVIYEPWKVPGLSRCGLETSVKKLTTREDVWKELQEFLARPGSKGWIETTDALLSLPGVDNPDMLAWPLNAELAAGATSLHVRQIDGAWLATSLTEMSKGRTHWATDRQHLAADPALGQLLYRVYMLMDDDGALHDEAVRLIDARKD